MDRLSPTGHIDDFCARNFPPVELLPDIFYSDPILQYPPLLNCAAELLDRAVDQGWGARTAIIHKSRRYSYGELLDIANRIANVLVDNLALVPGNRVLLRGPNHPMMVASWLAVLKAGGVAVTSSPLLRARELIAIADKANITHVLTDSRVDADCRAAFEGREIRICSFNCGSAESLDSLITSSKSGFANRTTSATDAAILAFTSGTTGSPKATIHTHRDIMAGTDCFSTFILRPQPSDVFIGSPPLGFTYALGGLLLFPLRHGASTVMLEKVAPSDLLAAIAEYRATICFTAPTAYRAMLKELRTGQVASLRKCVSAGEALPRSTFEQWLAATGLKIIDGIGSTEMLHIFISACEEDIRPGATGKAIPGYEARVVDDCGSALGPRRIGHLAVRGCTGCKYLDDPEQQKKYVQNGWNLTGDSYLMDEDGYFWYQSRTDDIIVSSGYNISGIEIEHVLLDHEKVSECAVIGIPDEDRGHLVKAFVVPAGHIEGCPELEKELQEWVKSQIAPYKYPRKIEFVSSLPRTGTGKLQRFHLRRERAQ